MAAQEQSAPGADAVLRAVRRSLLRNRVAGLHFPGHFLDVERRRFAEDGVVLAMPAGAHLLRADGSVALAPVAMLADLALAAAIRPFMPQGVRTATVAMHLDFTGVPAAGEVVATARCAGFSRDAALPQAYCTGEVGVPGGVVCHATASFVRLPSPPGTTLIPHPWEVEAQADHAVDEAAELTVAERRILRRARACLSGEEGAAGFIERFWGPATRSGAAGRASGSLALGTHTGNRNGHVQGGLTVGLAAATAAAAVPGHRSLHAISSWFVSPGHGSRLTARSEVLQQGRNLAVVRTQVFGAGRRRVLEAISQHAVRARAHD